MLRDSVTNTEQKLFSAVEVMTQKNNENKNNSANSVYNVNENSVGEDSTQLKILQLLNTISGALNQSNTSPNTGNNANYKK